MSGHVIESRICGNRTTEMPSPQSLRFWKNTEDQKWGLCQIMLFPVGRDSMMPKALQWLWNYWHKLCSLPLSLVGKAEQASSASWMKRCYLHNHENLLWKPEYLKTQEHRSQHTQWPAMSPLVIRGVITAAGTRLLHFGHTSHACKRKCCHK